MGTGSAAPSHGVIHTREAVCARCGWPPASAWVAKANSPATRLRAPVARSRCMARCHSGGAPGAGGTVPDVATWAVCASDVRRSVTIARPVAALPPPNPAHSIAGGAHARATAQAA